MVDCNIEISVGHKSYYHEDFAIKHTVGDYGHIPYVGRFVHERTDLPSHQQLS